MAENTKEPRGLSAAQARRPAKRAKQPSTRSPPRVFTIRRGDEVVLEGGLRDVLALFPDVRGSLVTRRLDGGERDFDRLARPPEPPAKRKRKLGEISMYRRKSK